MRYVKCIDEAEDLTQEAFLIAYEKLSTFKGESQFSSWLYAITQNLILTKYRKEKKIWEIPSENFESFSSQILCPEKHILEQELKHFLNSLLEKLPRTYRIPIQLHYFEGLSYAEISNKLNIKLNTLKSHILRGKELLKTWFEKESSNEQS